MALSHWSFCLSLPWTVLQSPLVCSMRLLVIRKLIPHCSTAFLWRIKFSVDTTMKHNCFLVLFTLEASVISIGIWIASQVIVLIPFSLCIGFTSSSILRPYSAISVSILITSGLNSASDRLIISSSLLLFMELWSALSFGPYIYIFCLSTPVTL